VILPSTSLTLALLTIIIVLVFGLVFRDTGFATFSAVVATVAGFFVFFCYHNAISQLIKLYNFKLFGFWIFIKSLQLLIEFCVEKIDELVVL
jgi:hypothetical protein